MKLKRRALRPTGAEPISASLHALFHPGSWVVESGCTPPPAHRPGALLERQPARERMAASLRTATLLKLNVGAEFTDQLKAVGCILDPFADVALHEILVNAAIHGNLEVDSGKATDWGKLAAREDRIAAALADPVRASRIVTIAVGWDAHLVSAVVIDQGQGYAMSPAGRPANGSPWRAAGRGLVLARAAARLDVLRGGTCARLIFERQPIARHG